MAKKSTRIFIHTDLEGASGVYCFAQTRQRQSPLYREAIEYLMGDIAAVVAGLHAAGPCTITVSDGHGSGANFIPHLMAPGATYLTGQPRPRNPELFPDSDAIILLGFHSMNHTQDGVLCHTQSSINEGRYWYNDRESGEIAQMAMLAGSRDIPVIMVSGDVATCREARDFLGPEVVTVATKRGIAREAAELYPFEATRAALHQGAQRALAALPHCKPYKLTLPLSARRTYNEFTEDPGFTRPVERAELLTDFSDIFTF